MNLTKNLEPIQALWVGTKLTTLEIIAINSFICNGHEFHLYAYNLIDGVPATVKLYDANEVLPARFIFEYKNSKSYAGFANYFRYHLLREKGGWWVDLDVISLKPFIFEDEYVFASEANPNGPDVVTNCVIRVPRRTQIMDYACEVCSTKDPKLIEWGETGPLLMQAAVPRFNLQHNVKSATTFCPIPFFRWPNWYYQTKRFRRKKQQSPFIFGMKFGAGSTPIKMMIIRWGQFMSNSNGYIYGDKLSSQRTL